MTVSPISGNTSEDATTATFTVVLTSQPSDDVTIPITSGDTSEGTVAPASLTFTAANWDTAQTVTVTGVNDDAVDGDITYTVSVEAATSADPNYNSLDPADVSVTNTDNDSAGVTVSPISGNTSEDATTATFTVVLTSQPSNDVTIPITSGDTSEGTVAPASLTFTAANWDTAQTVTVTGVNDDAVDGDITYTVSVEAATSADPNYNSLDPADVSVTNTDNDSAGVTVSPISGNTSEDATTATFTVVLTSQPSNDVTIPITSGDTSEGTVAPASLTFTAANWDTAQTVTVTGVNDDAVDGDITYTVSVEAATSADPNYNSLDPADVSVTNTDNDSAGVTVSPISGNTSEDATTATFTVVLTSQPSNDVTIPITSGDTSEGTVAPASLTFTAANWDTAQTVTVTGVNDDAVDGDITYTVSVEAATSADPNYNSLDPADVSVTNTDNDSAGVTVSPISGNTSEDATTATFTVVLTSQPSNDVTIPITSGDTSEGTVAPASLTFTAANWDTAQTVTVTGVNDDAVDGDITYTVSVEAATSADPNYNSLDPADVSVTNTDNDSAGVTVSPISGNTSEDATTATFTVVLTSQPSNDVTIPITSGDTSEGTVAPASLTFTAANWDTAQTVTVTGVNDDAVDGDITYTVSVEAATSADPNYNSLDPADVSVTNTDNDSAGVTVSPISGNTSEDATTATFTVVLTSQPSNDVTIPITSGDTSEGTVAPASLTFTAANWDTAQTVTVTGVNDDAVDGDITYTVSVEAATSADPNYNGLDPADVERHQLR